MAMNIEIEVTAPAESSEGFHGICYGPPGCGKTSTLDDPKFKVLQIDLEGGSTVLRDAPNVKRIDIPALAAKNKVSQFRVLTEVLNQIETEKLTGYDLYALDSITQYEAIVKDFIAKEYVPNRRREIQDKFGAQSDWGDLKDLITRNVKYVHSLTKRGSKSIHFLWLAHTLEEKDELTKVVTRTKIALQGANTSDVVMSIVDGYFYMYNKSVKNEATGEYDIERGILTRQAAHFSAKTRISKHRNPLPSKIVTPVWSDIIEDKLGYVRQ